MPDDAAVATWLAGGISGPDRLAQLIPFALKGFAAGAAERGAVAPPGGPVTVAAQLAAAFPNAAAPALSAQGV
jgi:hypothetical protein